MEAAEKGGYRALHAQGDHGAAAALIEYSTHRARACGIGRVVFGGADVDSSRQLMGHRPHSRSRPAASAFYAGQAGKYAPEKSLRRIPVDRRACERAALRQPRSWTSTRCMIVIVAVPSESGGHHRRHPTEAQVHAARKVLSIVNVVGSAIATHLGRASSTPGPDPEIAVATAEGLHHAGVRRMYLLGAVPGLKSRGCNCSYAGGGARRTAHAACRSMVQRAVDLESRRFAHACRALSRTDPSLFFIGRNVWTTPSAMEGLLEAQGDLLPALGGLCRRAS